MSVLRLEDNIKDTMQHTTSKLKRTQSDALFNEAKTYFPGGVNSPVRAFKSVEGSPLFIKNGNGCMIIDEDGNQFIDFCCSWGPLILGHNNPEVKQAIISTVENGTTFGTPTAVGNTIGKLILDNHRYIDKLRFVSSGTEAVMSALRLARGYTSKSKIVKFEGCYHGHVDSLLVKAGSGLATFGVSTSAGVPESFAKDTLVLPLNDLQGVRELLQSKSDEIAAVIIEPVPANNGLLLQDKDYLIGLRDLCTEYGVLLIFDEVISGFRVGFEGAAGYYGIQPDIITFGKIIGGGMPVGAYGGRADIMAHIAPDGPVYQAGTLSANPVTLAAGIATLTQLLDPNFYPSLRQKTEHFVQSIKSHITSKGYEMQIVTIGSIFWFAFGHDRIIRSDQIDPASMEKFKRMHGELLNNGVYLGPSGYEVGFISSAQTYKTLDQASKIICKAIDNIF